jgi:hypothetical protein
MTEHTMHGIAKHRIKDALVARARTQAEASRESIEDHESAAKQAADVAAIEGLALGDTFDFRDRKQTVDFLA